MSRYDGLIIPRSYSEYINKTDAATLLQALQLSGVMDAAPTADSNHPVKSGGVETAFNQATTMDKLINALGVGNDTPVDGDYMITQWVGGGTETKTYHRRNISKIKDYMFMIKQVTDANTAVPEQDSAFCVNYSRFGNQTNTPDGSFNWFYITFKLPYDDNYRMTQLAIANDRATSPAKIYLRTYNITSNAWNAWAQI